MPDYNPTADYSAAYEAARRKLTAGYGQQLGALQERTRNIRTSGVSTIPEGQLRGAQLGAEGDLAGDFALEQARTGIEDRRAAQQFERQKELARIGQDYESASAKAAARRSLQGGLLAGGIGAVGSLLGPIGKVAAPVVSGGLVPLLTQQQPGYRGLGSRTDLRGRTVR